MIRSFSTGIGQSNSLGALYMLFLCLALGSSPLACEELSPPPTVTLKQCIEIALDQNPRQRAAGAGISIAQADVGIAGSPYYPQANFRMYGGRFQQHIFFPKINAPIQIPSIVGPIDDFSLHVRSSYILYDSGERHARLYAAIAQEAMAVDEADKIRQEIILNVTLAYYGLLANLEQKYFAINSLERSNDHLQIARQRREVGDVPLADVLRTDVEVAQSKQDLIRSESMVRISLGNLNTTMGITAESEIRVEELPMDVEEPHAAWLSQGLINATNYRPELRAAYNKLIAYNENINAARSAFGPRFVAEGTIGHRDDQFFPHDEEWSLGISMELPIFRGFALENELRKSQAAYCQEKANYDSLILQVRQEVWNAYSRLVESFQSTQTSIAQVASATESLRMATERYKVGAGTITDVLDSQNALILAETSLVDSRWNYRSSYIVFQWTQGLLDEDCFPSPPLPLP